jgi:DNA-directed RNA polymerase beta subunit
MLVICIKNIKWCLGLANQKYKVRLSDSRKNYKSEVNTGKLLKVNIKTKYLRKDIITTKMFTIDVSGPLDSIGTTQLTEQVFIARSHVECG